MLMKISVHVHFLYIFNIKFLQILILWNDTLNSSKYVVLLETRSRTQHNAVGYLLSQNFKAIIKNAAKRWPALSYL